MDNEMNKNTENEAENSIDNQLEDCVDSSEEEYADNVSDGFGDNADEGEDNDGGNTAGKPKSNKTDIIIIVICCLLIAACIAFFIWKLIPSSSSDPTSGEITGQGEFTPTVDFDENMLFDFAGEDLTKYLTLGEYKGIKVNTTVAEKTPEQIAADIDSIMSMFAEEIEITDKAIAMGDTVCADVVMLADGEEVPDSDDEDIYVSVTEAEDNIVAPSLVGHMPGDTVIIDVTDDIKEKYGDKSETIKDAGKVEWKFTVKYIREEKLPERTDEFAKEKLGCETFDDFVLAYTLSASKEYALSKDEALYDNILDTAYANCTVKSKPDAYIANMFNYYKYQYEYYAYSYNMTYEDFMDKYVGMTDDELKADIEKYVMEEIMLYSIAKAENLGATDEEITKYAESAASEYGMTAEEFIAEYGKDAIAEIITTGNAQDFLIANTQLIYAEPTEPTATAAGTEAE